MNNEKNVINNDIEVNVSEDALFLAPPAALFDEAKEIAQNTSADEKFPFTLHYDANQKDQLLSMLQMVGAIVEKDDEEARTLSTRMNMTQLALIKRLDSVERVRSNSPKEAVSATELETSVEMMAVENTAEKITPEDGIAVASTTASTRSSCSSTPTNTSMATAKQIYDESFTSGNISCPGMEQWFKFTATQTCQYTICTTTANTSNEALDTIGTLYDSCGVQLAEVDDSDDINFRIILNLTADEIYYVKVRLYGNDTGSYSLRVTKKVLARYVTITPRTISLKKGVLYELPVTPNYTYKGYNGAQRIPGLSVSITPANTTNQEIRWYQAYGSSLNLSSDFDDDGDQYIHVTATGNGTAKLYAIDSIGYGLEDVCTVAILPYCGGSNYRDVTQHSLELQEDGYYVCSTCGYRVKSPELQDKDILSTDDYLRVISAMHYYVHNVLLAQKYPISSYFYDAEAKTCKIVIDTIRSQSQYSALYEYQGANNRYLAGETNDVLASFVAKSSLDSSDIEALNVFYESLASLVIGYCCPQVATLLDIIDLLQETVAGKIDAMSFGAFIAGLVGEKKIEAALTFFSTASDIIECDAKLGDPIVNISFSAYAHAQYIFDANYNIKKVNIHYL